MQNASSTPALRTAHLGDILTFGPGHSRTVRAVAPALVKPSGVMTGFILAGEIGPDALLLALPASPNDPVTLYVPVDHVPEAREAAARVVCQGVVSYWAPHLPNFSGAQGELGYKVAELPGSFYPLVFIWRGGERIAFTRASEVPANQIGWTPMLRDAARTEVAQERHAAYIDAIARPAELPAAQPLPGLAARRRLRLPFRR